MRPGRQGRPRTRPEAVLGEKAYSSRAIGTHLRAGGIKAVLPNRLTSRATADAAAQPAADP